ncbi:MAG: spermidine synthase [Chloroflexota bacterium]|nr:spermidine synthase [Chloroflexota bacterium]
MRSRWPVLAIFVLSGAAGLIYEIVWSRQLVLVFGNTTQAVSAILAGFFGGMAIGSAFGGRLADRVRRPLRLYGIIELVLVVVVVATPLTFRLIRSVYGDLAVTLEGAPQVLAIIRLLLALVALAPATVLMGATLPTLTRHLTSDAHLSQSFGRLYAANTIGAIVGTVTAGLVLIELLGLSGALWVGAGCSAVAGMAALLLARGATATTIVASAPSPDVEAAGERAVGPGVTGPQSRTSLALTVAFISGVTSLGYQVLWTRLLASGTGNTTYVFTIILTVFLVGLALGALLFNIIRQRIADPVRLLAVAQILVAALVMVGLVAVAERPEALIPGGSPETLLALARHAILVVFPVTIVLGLSFPAAAALLADDTRHAGSESGSLIAVNTVGAIAGSVAIPFFLIPALGSPAVVALLAFVNAALGIALALRGRIPNRWMAMTGAVVAVAVVATTLAPGVLVQPNGTAILARGGRIFASTEDEIASVQAGQVTFTPELWVAGTSMTLLTVDAKLMPILPLIARPASTRALVVAFGMGSAFRAALIAGLRTDVVELVPSVPKMFGYYYPDAAAVLADPQGRVIVTDGRNHLELTADRFDIVLTDPPPPIESSGASVISSLEYYQAGRDHLTPDGIMMQWLPYGGSQAEFADHLRTFATVFRHVTIVKGAGGYGIYMLGSASPIAFDPASIRATLARPGVLADISSAYDSPAKTVDDWVAVIARQTWMTDDEIRASAGPGPLITDDRPRPEYFLLRRLFGDAVP